MIKEIISPSNQNIKHIKSLHKRKYRDKHKEFLIEGLRSVEHGLENNAEFRNICYNDVITSSNRGCKLLEKISQRKIELCKINDKIFKEISTTDSPQGILGVVKRRYYDLEDIISKDKLFLIILDKLQDPGNVGTIIRTADAAGVSCIISLKGTVDIYNSKTIRSTMGSIFSMPIIHIETIGDVIEILKGNGVDIISTTLEAERYHFEVKYGRKNAIIIGNEGNGISNELIKRSDIKVKIPIIGNAESLNASIAAGIIIYEIVRQTHFQKI
ncbi:23S rRNA (guanosine(2251)-2'-O)-methyltransferase RlmB [Maledivibacter halophilus]|uniref:RNA methyltransferase, TrmH family n=1 Tax=Maledivibacter halophilus TaxID=36842 RepID=A0A1T5IWT5_9FIRM|nr:23S rRNA (guanosine(2251)-2'-O)-methyltransferase RlmB [Maledivibacter halophilus]SKC43581.1 RNA methyltransferase, TrmH family [Maledivibacter halophilus]